MSASNKWRAMSHHQHQPLCTRTHQIGALLLVATTFFFTRMLSTSTLSTSVVHVSQPRFQWGQSQLSLKIYVYQEDEIDGLKELLRGRDAKITDEACLKGQWGSQVINSSIPFPIFSSMGWIECVNCRKVSGISLWFLGKKKKNLIS